MNLDRPDDIPDVAAYSVQGAQGRALAPPVSRAGRDQFEANGQGLGGRKTLPAVSSSLTWRRSSSTSPEPGYATSSSTLPSATRIQRRPDVLWSSTPLLTLPRYQYKMCSRMAASILKGALPKSPEASRRRRSSSAADDGQYEELAVQLASGLSYSPTVGGYGEGEGRLAELRRLLWNSKWNCALFNTRRWVSDLEDAYEAAWSRWVSGEAGDIYL